MINYGIQNELSDMRAHVSVSNRTVYYFPTQSGKDAITKGFVARPAYTGNMKTAIGYPVPVREIENMQAIRIPNTLFEMAIFSQEDDTSIKGNKAVFIVKEMIKKGLLPVSLKAEEIFEKDMQIKGTDIIVTAQCKIQVKCDWRAGETGNVYLQVAERNPFKKY